MKCPWRTKETRTGTGLRLTEKGIDVNVTTEITTDFLDCYENDCPLFNTWTRYCMKGRERK